MAKAGMNSAIALGAAAGMALLSACDAHVSKFEMNPRHICSGEKVTLTWDVTGSGRLKFTPPMTDGIAVDDSGTVILAPTQAMRATIDVTRHFGNPTSASDDVDLVPAGQSIRKFSADIGMPSASQGCDGSSFWMTIVAKKYSPMVTAGSVELPHADHHAYVISHGAQEDTLSSDHPASKFVGLPIVGDWKLKAPLLPGEKCGDPTGVEIIVQAQCPAGAANDS